ncbi:MAG: rRNA maturation RNase YbeY [Rickettsiales bacterium]|nr:rRNA maturation RNase YbeY [Rickettsiales bacterium]
MINIDVVVKSKKWQQEKNIENFIKKTCKTLIAFTDLKIFLSKNYELEFSVLLFGNSQIKKINQKFRQKNKPTNVLSFAALDENLLRKIGLKKLIKGSNYLYLGDIIIAYETLKSESIIQKKQFHDHLTHLILHSILHLIGFDHEDEKMAKKMENLEIKILKKLAIKNPYQQQNI